MEITDELKLDVWNKCRVSDIYDESKVRKDACGAWILFDEYGNINSPFGWEIDHIVPESRLHKFGVKQEYIDNIINLRALNIKNNRKKGDSYPVYSIAICAKDDDQNEEVLKTLVVNEKLQKELREYFKVEI